MARKTKKSRETWGIIDRQRSGRYRARYTHQGERFAAPHTFDSIETARLWLSRTRVDIQEGRWRHPDAIHAETFKPFALAWIEQRVTSKGEHLRENSKAEYRRYLDKGLANFADDRLADITAARIRAWHLDRAKAGKTAAAREARLLRAVFTTAVADGILEENPVDSRLCKTTTGKIHRAPTDGELLAMLSAFSKSAPQLRLALMLAAYGGLRLSEWRALRRRDLGFDGERYTVSITRQAARSKADWKTWIVGPPKSAEGVRIVHLPKRLTAEVTEHLAEHVGAFPDSLIFAPVGEAEYLDDQAFNRHWNRAREAAGVRHKIEADGEPTRYENEVTEHDLRAFAGTEYTKAGATIREVQAFLGHATIDAAMAYQRETGRAAELADRMSAPAPMPERPVSLEAKREERGA